MNSEEGLDKWAAWLLHRRDGGDPEQHRKALEHLVPIRETVLDHAAIVAGNRVLDVGAGDGLIAFAALDRVGPDGHVMMSDSSSDLVAHARTAAAELGVQERMSFVETRAQDLAAVANASVDAVTLRPISVAAAAFEASSYGGGPGCY